MQLKKKKNEKFKKFHPSKNVNLYISLAIKRTCMILLFSSLHIYYYHTTV